MGGTTPPMATRARAPLRWLAASPARMWVERREGVAAIACAATSGVRADGLGRTYQAPAAVWPAASASPSRLRVLLIFC